MWIVGNSKTKDPKKNFILSEGQPTPSLPLKDNRNKTSKQESHVYQLTHALGVFMAFKIMNKGS